MRKETLPTGRYEHGKLMLCNPYTTKPETVFTTCTPYGEMQDGTMVWADREGRQYTWYEVGMCGCTEMGMQPEEIDEFWDTHPDDLKEEVHMMWSRIKQFV